MIFDEFIKKIQGEIPLFLTEKAFQHPFVRRNDISTALGEK